MYVFPLFSLGQSLGKASTSGRTEPVPIEVKTGRGGIGRDAVLKDLAEKKEKMRREHIERRLREAMQKKAGPTPEEYR